jgi:hypothetical protein
MKTLRNHRPMRPGFHQVTRIGLLALTAGASIFIAGRASTPAPTEQMAVSTAALANPVSSGGPQWAPAELTTARDKLARANTALVAKDHDHARSLAEEAQADAQLAGAKARSAKARKAGDEVQEASRVLTEEMDRKTK